ncbi:MULTISPECIES: alpha/beta hydrolase [Pseudomonas]|jgi:alpha-beta hydrolase superfamily lysophospholipase|uniref:Alpha/beta hydrolase n=1 Tax=Pseudomonas juntendi TaxID=2666183 RepID=A0ABD4YDQ6_9PSED|nr:MULTISPECIES: alpha/beta hydrolase [Pseudomonas]MBH3374936.1 alpha/beta hydrolase [Pseudomonas juntendi]MBS6038841.1 alpha/beta hydrolase [Pseudomonas sp.]MDH0757485.1 alpha/beta hydrolase [Pseudomonas juntendi]MDH1920942.1 alpha/beta hydrolase [Pseudomonas juntendi]RRV68340.1 alpha/beta hydrolase [Pseudomonas sp. p99-361]
MPTLFLSHLRRRWLTWLCATLLVIGLPSSCAVLQHKERELVFRIEPGQASWFRGLPSGVQELDLRPRSFAANQSLHAWWWPARRANAPAILYLHGVRWNLTGQLFRIEQLHAMGYSVLAVDYRGFGQSRGGLPSEATVYEDARIAWERFAQLQPDAGKRLIFGHSLGGAVAVELARALAAEARQGGDAAPARGLILESTFTSLGDVAAAVANTSLPVRWLLSQKFDSLGKIQDIGLPVLLVHGLDDRFVPARFSQQLYEAARQPKTLLLVPGASHNNSMSLAGPRYRQAIQALL